MAEWHAVCRLDEIAEGRGRTVEVAGLRLALIRQNDSVAALLDRCPHAGGSLGQGWLEDGELLCPLHRWRFKLGDGRCSTMPGQGVHRFRSDVRDGIVHVEA